MKHRGFTLVELLIVIVVIGVLSAMMMLSSTEAVSSAKAADIISDLRNLRTAVLSWYADNMDRVVKTSKGYSLDTNGTVGYFSNLIHDHSDEVTKYFNNSIKIDNRNNVADNGYIVDAIKEDKLWIVGYRTTDRNVQAKLASRASSVGLLNGTKDGPGEDRTTHTTYTGGEYVFMEVMSLE